MRYAPMYILLALMCFGISGCGVSSEELYAKAITCELDPQTKGVACEQHWADWNKREEQIELRRKKKQFMSQCKILGSGYYLYCNNETMDQCWRNLQNDRGGHCRCECIKGSWYEY